MNDTVVEAEHVSKKFSRGLRNALRHGAADIGREFLPWKQPHPELRHGEFWALKDIDFQLQRGDSLAVVGANGAGKSTLLKILAGLLKPDEGRIRVRGRLRAMIELGAAFNPVLSGRENVFVQGTLYGYKRTDLTRQIDSIVDFAGLEKFIDVPVQQYSDGMKARLGFAVAITLDPDILLVDEVLAVGDIAFQNKCINHMRRYLERGGTLIFVGHASHHVQTVCRTAMVLVDGRVMFSGGVVDALDYYLKNLPRPNNAFASHGERDTNDGTTPGCRITSVNAEGIDATGAVTNDGMVVTVEYEADADFDKVSLGVTVYTYDGLAVAGAMASPPVSVRRGRGKLGMAIKPVPLFPGEYHLRAYLFDREINFPIALYGWDQAPHSFEMTSPLNSIVTGSVMAGLNVYMNAEWQTASHE